MQGDNADKRKGDKASPEQEDKDMMTIWNNAYEVYVEGDYCLMWDYLRAQVKNGNITQDDAECMAEDIVGTANL